ncbi:hypothetical protein [Erysipelothrix tonsillarum]|uniref:hypothetical protein n=1 Tax=Erysipelothrix tonsillarum TaxID=38402 RepID=UPI00036A15E1|nr:hypothetical protein [Erysipelothrix tonsillarum]
MGRKSREKKNRVPGEHVSKKQQKQAAVQATQANEKTEIASLALSIASLIFVLIGVFTKQQWYLYIAMGCVLISLILKYLGKRRK